MIGYLRLRYGFFRADLYDCGGKTVYRALPEGDGCFTPEERNDYLSKAVDALQQALIDNA